MNPLAGWTPPDRGALFVVSGASGTGKSTLLRHLFATVPGLEFSVSATTRSPRPGEVDGVHYHFVSPERFAELRDGGQLLEHAAVYGRSYGTLRAPVEGAIAAGRSVVLDIDVQGAAQVRASHPEAVTVFILPPSLEATRARLEARGTDSPAVIEARLAEAGVQLGGCGDYDYLVMNDDLETAVAQLVGIVVAELSRTARRGSWVRRFRA